MGTVADRVIAVGEGGAHSPVVWESTDGLTWARQEFACGETCDVTGFGHIWQLPGQLALRGSYDLTTEGDRIDQGGVWLTVDGIGWTREVDDSEFGQGIAVVFSSADAIGFVGVEPGVPEDEGDEVYHLWLRSGTVWEEVPIDQPLFDLGHLGGLDDSAFFAGQVWLMGSDVEGTTVWNSSDGRTWERQNHVVPGVNASVAVVGDLLVMHNTVAGRAHLWTSADGVTWSGGESNFVGEIEITEWQGHLLGYPWGAAESQEILMSSDLASWQENH